MNYIGGIYDYLYFMSFLSFFLSFVFLFVSLSVLYVLLGGEEGLYYLLVDKEGDPVIEQVNHSLLL